MVCNRKKGYKCSKKGILNGDVAFGKEKLCVV